MTAAAVSGLIRTAVLAIVLVCGVCRTVSAQSCDDKLAQDRRQWGASHHAWLASVFHTEATGVSETWCRIFEARGADRVPKIEDFGRTVFTGEGIHPSVGSIVPGSGLAAGAAVNVSRALQSVPLRLSGSVEGRRSTSGFWNVGGRLDLVGSGDTDENRHINATITGTYHALPALAFFGIGQESTLAEETSFGLDLLTIGGRINVPLPAAFTMSGSLEGLLATSRGPRALRLATDHVAVGGGISWRHPIDERLRGYRTNVTAGWRLFHAVQDAPYSFRRVDAEWRQLWSPDVAADLGEVAVVARFTGSTASHEDWVPFYLQPTLGGADINGIAALRSYRDYRFRAQNALAVQVEYEHALGRLPLGVWGFVDAGQVAARITDFELGRFRHSVGAGITLHAGGGPVMKLYFAWGGGEGSHTTFTGNSNTFGPEGSPRGVF